jgi:hypothetical protein
MSNCLRLSTSFSPDPGLNDVSRRFVDHAIRILAAVALLLAVMSSPIRPDRASYTAPPPNFHPRNLALYEFGHSGQFATSARPSLREADSLRFEIEGFDFEDELDANIEDELTVTSPPASVSFELCPSPCPKPHSELVRFADPLAAPPLRC